MYVKILLKSDNPYTVKEKEFFTIEEAIAYLQAYKLVYL